MQFFEKFMLNNWLITSVTFLYFTFLCQATELIPISHTTPKTNYVATKISIIRSNTSELPESINREAYATIDRARSALIDLQNTNGTWRTNLGFETVLPAIALLDINSTSEYYSNEIDNATNAAKNWLEIKANKPWSIQETKEVAISINLLTLTQKKNLIPQAAISHLKKNTTQSLHGLDPIGKYFFILALAQYDELPQESFDTIIREQAQIKESELLPICMIGISRLMRSKSEIPPNDAKAYLRFLANKLQLGYHNLSPGENEVLFPQLGFLTMIFASSFTNRQLALDTSLFPYDWRNHLANRIIALQIYCTETGAPYWRGELESDSRTSYNSLEATTLAIITLSNLVN